MKWLFGMAMLTVCGLLAGALFHAPARTQAASVKTHVVMIRGYAFVPSRLVITVGDRVLWINRDSDTHTVTSDGNATTALISRPLGSGARFSMTFSRSGTYQYHCNFHPFMHGMVKVRTHSTRTSRAVTRA